MPNTNNHFLEVFVRRQNYGDHICPICHRTIGGLKAETCVDPAVIIAYADDEEGFEPWAVFHKTCWDAHPELARNIEDTYAKYNDYDGTEILESERYDTEPLAWC